MSHQTITHPLVFADQLDELNFLADKALTHMQPLVMAWAASQPPIWDSMLEWFGNPCFTVPELDWAAQ